MFGKLFGSKKVPQNEGSLEPSRLNRLQIIKVFELELTNMEGSPAYSLSHQLTIGSEIGNIIIADPSVSPRHATFILQQEVVSVIDHGSVAGTLVNSKKIPSGRYIILEESDIINIGDLEIRIRTENETVPVEDLPENPDEDLPIEPEVESPEEEQPQQQMEADDKTPTPSEMPNLMNSNSMMGKLKNLFKPKDKTPPPVVKPGQQVKAAKVDNKAVKPSKFGNLFKIFRKPAQKTTSKLEIGLTSSTSYSANSLVRVVAVLLDLLLSYSLVVILWPFDEYRNFIESIPAGISELIEIEWEPLWISITEDYGFVRELAADAYTYTDGLVHVLPLFFTFILLRLLSTIIFGVSISEYLLSIKAAGNQIWARIGGLIRVLIGVITGPFLIFDVPAVVSRRTFKEFMTFTNIQLRSKFIAILSTILVIPLFISLALVAPLLQGFEPPESIIVNDKLDQRVKVKGQPVQPGQPEGPAAEVIMATNVSRFLNLELNYNPAELTLIPSVKFQGIQKKLNITPEMIFYHKDLQRPVSFEVMKTFDLKQLLGIGIKGNYFLSEKFPEIYAFVYQAEGSTSIKAPINAKSQISFANEVMRFTKLVFELNLSNAMEIMEMETPLIKGLIDFRSSFLSLLEYKDFDQIGFIKLGNVTFMKISFPKQKPFDLIIPLVKGEGRIYKVEYDKKENLSAIASKFYKYSLNKSNWIGVTPPVAGETLDALQVIDLLSYLNENKKVISADKAQSLYGYYFEKSSEILKKGDAIEYDLWKKSLASVIKVIENLQGSKPVSEEQPDAVNSIEKLNQNFKDLNEAVESKNMEYFGVTEIQTI